jgi:hypothetical protein
MQGGVGHRHFHHLFHRFGAWLVFARVWLIWVELCDISAFFHENNKLVQQHIFMTRPCWMEDVLIGFLILMGYHFRQGMGFPI